MLTRLSLVCHQRRCSPVTLGVDSEAGAEAVVVVPVAVAVDVVVATQHARFEVEVTWAAVVVAWEGATVGEPVMREVTKATEVSSESGSSEAIVVVIAAAALAVFVVFVVDLPPDDVLWGGKQMMGVDDGYLNYLHTGSAWNQ